MLWRLFSSDARVLEALEQSTVSYDLSPVTLAANNDEPGRPVAAAGTKPPSRLWLEDWNEKDEERLRQSSTEENNWDWDNLINTG